LTEAAEGQPTSIDLVKRRCTQRSQDKDDKSSAILPEDNRRYKKGITTMISTSLDPKSSKKRPRSISLRSNNGCSTKGRLADNPTQQRNRQRKNQTKPTAWVDHWELNAVGKSLCAASELFVENADNLLTTKQGHELGQAESMALSEAIERVAVWRTRQTQLPHIVESSAALAEILLREATTATGCSAMELRHAYACAVIRSINGLADPLQQQRSVATSIALLCRQLGLPSWLVDVRHEATHNQMPTLAVLRMAAKTLLQYFQAVYWKPIANIPVNYNEEAYTLLEEYARRTLPRQAEFISEEDNATSQQDSDKSVDDNGSREEEEAMVGGRRLGTTTNSFALLMEPKKIKPVKLEKKEKIKKKKRKNVSVDALTKSALAFVQAKIPVSEAFRSLLSFLVWGFGGTSGVLVPQASGVFSVNSFGVQQIRKHYIPLISAAVKEWPGFHRALFIHLFEFLFVSEQRVVIRPVEPSLARSFFFAKSWIQHLLTRQFFDFVDPELVRTDTAFEETDLMPLSILEDVGYPLNSLCDRLEIAKLKGFAHFDCIASVVETFRHILGDTRVARHGYPESQAFTLPEKEFTAIDPLQLLETETLENNASLDEIEAMLAGQVSTTCEDDDMRNKAIKCNPPLTKEGGADCNIAHGAVVNEKQMNCELVDNNFFCGQSDPQPHRNREETTDLRGTAVTSELSQLPEEVSSLDIKCANESTTLQTGYSFGNPNSGRKTRPVWKYCKSWDECSVGALPGRPS
jgi:ribosomal biogenesis protein LAS1